MKRIFKYEIGLGGVVELPVGYQIIKVGEQHGDLMLWAIVDPDADRAAVALTVLTTGSAYADYVGEHVGTAIMGDGDFVVHVFDVR